jgi:hypothetical protein
MHCRKNEKSVSQKVTKEANERVITTYRINFDTSSACRWAVICAINAPWLHPNNAGPVVDAPPLFWAS